MARHGYHVAICDDAGCQVVKKLRKLEAAKRAMIKAFRKKAKGLLAQATAGRLRGEVREFGRGLPDDGRVVYERDLRSGEPGMRRAPRRRREAAPDALAGAEE